jgi:hypothetical protein
MTTGPINADAAPEPSAAIPASSAGTPAEFSEETMAAMLSRLKAAGVEIPGASQERRRSRSVLKYIGFGILIVGLVALYVRGYLQQHDHFQKLTIWQVIWLTAPIAGAGAFVAYQYAAGRGFQVGHLVGLVVGTAGTSYLTAISSGHQVSNSLFQFDPNCLMQAACSTASPLSTANPASYVLKVVNNYWHVYGATGFASAAIIGAVIGLGLGLASRRTPGRVMP